MKIGATTRSQISGFVEIDSEKLIKHDKFTPDPLISYDIGLIKLKKAISSSGEFIKYPIITRFRLYFM